MPISNNNILLINMLRHENTELNVQKCRVLLALAL
jgi:hypothetical protein